MRLRSPSFVVAAGVLLLCRISKAEQLTRQQILQSAGFQDDKALWDWLSSKTLRIGADDDNPVFNHTDGKQTCRERLFDFYVEQAAEGAAQGSYAQENRVDAALCKAGLWDCPRPAKSNLTCAEQRQTNETRAAFVILATDHSMKGKTSPQQLKALLKELEDPSFLTVVHLDENSSPDYKDVVGSIVKPFARASLARSPVPCSWGGASLVAAQLSALADAVLLPPEACVDLVINLSEADFPVQSSAAIKRRLQGLVGTSRLDFFTRQGSADNFLTAPDRGNTSRYPDRFYLPECWTKPISIEAGDIDPRTNHSLRKDSSIENWQVVHGSQWWVLSREAALHLVTNATVQHLWRYLKHTHVPDESFFHTALLNTPRLAANTHPGALRLIGKRAKGRRVTEQDVPRMLECQTLFARKFISAGEARNLTRPSRERC